VNETPVLALVLICACIVIIAFELSDIKERLDALEAVINNSTVIRP